MELKFRDVVAFRTEDAKFPAANLLRGGKWLSERKSRSSMNDIILHLGESHLISHIDVGNWGSSFIHIEVSRIGLQRYQTLLPSTELMSLRDALTKKNWTCVQMFSNEHFIEAVQGQKWNLIRVTCLQPFLQDEQFGLSFLKVFSVAEKELPPGQPEPQSPPPGSVFAMMRDSPVAKVNPLGVNRSQQLVLAAIEKQKTSMKRKEAIMSLSLCDSESSPVTDCSPFKRVCDRTNILHSSTKDSPSNLSASQNHAVTLQSSTQTSRKFLSPISSRSHKCSVSRLDRLGLSPKINIQKHSSSSDATRDSTEVSRNKKQKLPVLTTRNLMKSPVSKAASLRCKPSSEQLKLFQCKDNSVCKGKPEICDLTTTSDSDSDASTIVMPLATLSPSREQIDFDSDTETVILVDDVHCNTAEFSPIGILSSPKQSSSRILPSDSDAVPGPSRICCPLCSDLFDESSIEEHAATCSLTSETEEMICPICSGYFPLDVLPRHADLCAERTLS